MLVVQRLEHRGFFLFCPGDHAMTPRRKRFVEEYLRSLDVRRAAERAGYSPASAGKSGWRLLRNRAVAAAIAEGEKRRAEGRVLDADRVVRELMSVAFSDIRRFARWDEGKLVLVPRETLAPGEAAAIAQIAPGGKTRGARIRLHGKRRALKALARHVGLFDDQAFADPAELRERAARVRAMLLDALVREERAAAARTQGAMPPEPGPEPA